MPRLGNVRSRTQLLHEFLLFYDDELGVRVAVKGCPLQLRRCVIAFFFLLIPLALGCINYNDRCPSFRRTYILYPRSGV